MMRHRQTLAEEIGYARNSAVDVCQIAKTMFIIAD